MFIKLPISLSALFFVTTFLVSVNKAVAQTVEPYEFKIIDPDPDRGLYVIWYGNSEELLKLPFIYGGQVTLQWADLETGEGVYNFKPLDSALQRMKRLGKKVTVQVNGNQKPAYLYDRIAVNPKKLSPQVKDPQGTLQFWDPAYLDYYLNFIKAYGQHLRESTLKNVVIGVRLNYNTIGTEHYFNDIGADQYKTTSADKDYLSYHPAPNGHRFEQSFTDEFLADYMTRVVETYISSFNHQVRILARYDGLMPGRGNDSILRNSLEHGEMGVFMTNADARHAHNVKAQIFLDYCRTGKAVGYAEQFSGSEGQHAGTQMNFPQWPSAWNYWRLLGDLDLGISFIAIYGSDLKQHSNTQYDDAFQFAKKYVGYHASPSVSPGAWVALRSPGYISKEKVVAKSGPLENLGLLMTETSRSGQLLTNCGPRDQRYGSWARSVGEKETLTFKLNADFARSMEGKSAQLRVIYLDTTQTAFTMTYYQQGLPVSKTIKRTDTRRWKEAFIEIPSAELVKAGADDITISGGGIFHLVELCRKPGGVKKQRPHNKDF